MRNALKADIRAYLRHLRSCASHSCAVCNQLATSALHYIGTVDSHAYAAQPCDCGLEDVAEAWHQRNESPE
jgi:hypothetical protein